MKLIKCIECNGINVHSLEFRMDYSRTRVISSVNQCVKEISNDDLPYRLEGHYCKDCDILVSVFTEKIEE